MYVSLGLTEYETSELVSACEKDFVAIWSRVAIQEGALAKECYSSLMNSFFLLEAAWLNEVRCPGGRPSVS